MLTTTEQLRLVDRIVVTWPNGRVEDFRNVATGRAYDCTEGKGLAPRS